MRLPLNRAKLNMTLLSLVTTSIRLDYALAANPAASSTYSTITHHYKRLAAAPHAHNLREMRLNRLEPDIGPLSLITASAWLDGAVAVGSTTSNSRMLQQHSPMQAPRSTVHRPREMRLIHPPLPTAASAWLDGTGENTINDQTPRTAKLRTKDHYIEVIRYVKPRRTAAFGNWGGGPARVEESSIRSHFLGGS